RAPMSTSSSRRDGVSRTSCSRRVTIAPTSTSTRPSHPERSGSTSAGVGYVCETCRPAPSSPSPRRAWYATSSVRSWTGLSRLSRPGRLRKRNEPDDRKRRERQLDRPRLPVPLARLRGKLARVDETRAAVHLGVGVQELAPGAAARQADAIPRPWDRRKVLDADQGPSAVGAVARKGERVRRSVADLEPAEPRRVEVALPQRRLVAVDQVEIANEALDARVGRLL